MRLSAAVGAALLVLSGTSVAETLYLDTEAGKSILTDSPCSLDSSRKTAILDQHRSFPAMSGLGCWTELDGGIIELEWLRSIGAGGAILNISATEYLNRPGYRPESEFSANHVNAENTELQDWLTRKIVYDVYDNCSEAQGIPPDIVESVPDADAWMHASNDLADHVLLLPYKEGKSLGAMAFTASRGSCKSLESKLVRAKRLVIIHPD
ncbi:MAG: hypothetical protein JKY26_12170 [Pseudomonas sp.]|nr:hypothetical protein [Pseudomonas sp.]